MIFPVDSPAPTDAGIALLLRLDGARYRAFGPPGSEVAPCPPPVTVPGCPPWLRGLVLHKGEAWPLVDLGMALDEAAAPAPDEHARMLATVSGGCRFAFLVADVDVDDGREGVPALDLDALSRELLTRAAGWPLRERPAT